MMRIKNREGFTLIELIVTIAVLIVLAGTAIVVINPVEYMRQSRDTKRVVDIDAIDNALRTVQSNNLLALAGLSTSTVSVSLPDTSSTCANWTGLPQLPAPYVYRCVSAANLRKTDGTGWIPLNFAAAAGGAALAALPVDPVNADGKLQYYLFIQGAGKWIVSASLEADKNKGIDGPMGVDKGGSMFRYEQGTDTSLDPVFNDMVALVGYWPLSEGAGMAVADKSRTGNDGTLSGNATWVAGNRADTKAVQFGTPTASIGVGTSPSLLPAKFTITAWIKPGVVSTAMWSTIFSNTNGWDGGNGIELDLSGGTIMGTIYGNGTYRTQFSGLPIPDNAPWQFVVFTYDGVNMALYRNGALDVTGAMGADLVRTPAAYPNTIGRQGNPAAIKNDSTFPGAINNIRVYARPLSAFDVNNLYQWEK